MKEYALEAYKIIYDKPSLTNALLPLLKDKYLVLLGIFFTLVSFFYILILFKRMLDSDEQARSLEAIHKDVLISIGLALSFPVVAISIVSVFNFIADAIFDISSKDDAFLKLIGARSEYHSFKVFGFVASPISELVRIFTGILASLAHHNIIMIRIGLLGLMIVTAPVILSFGLNPLYGLEISKNLLMLVTQVASWSMFKSAADYIYYTMYNASVSKGLIGAKSDWLSDSVMSTVYSSCVSLIPLIAYLIFKGGNFMAISLTSLAMQKAVLDQAVNAPKNVSDTAANIKENIDVMQGGSKEYRDAYSYLNRPPTPKNPFGKK